MAEFEQKFFTIDFSMCKAYAIEKLAHNSFGAIANFTRKNFGIAPKKFVIQFFDRVKIL